MRLRQASAPPYTAFEATSVDAPVMETGDPTHMHQILMHLFRSAAEAIRPALGVALIGEGLHFHIPKGYIYFAMAFSIAVEMVNLRVRKVHRPVKLHGPKSGDA